MVMLTLWINTQMAYWPDLEQVLRGGQVIRAAGVLNIRWEDFSALDFAREAGLQEVIWDALQDDTCGSLELTVLYFQATQAEIAARVTDPYVRIALDDYDLTETVDRQIAETDR